MIDHRLVVTHSGRLLTTDGGGPSLEDIALGLSRQPRFGGQSRIWWSVLDHSLYCDELVKHVAKVEGVPTLAGDDEESTRLWRLAVLLHDAHEALTGDCPSPLKTDDFIEMQSRLDNRIMSSFFPGGKSGYLAYHHAVHRIDQRALLAEARLVLPHSRGKVEELFGPANETDYAILERLEREPYARIPPFAGNQLDHPGVLEYQRRVISLM